jgi:hypothetical protein
MGVRATGGGGGAELDASLCFLAERWGQVLGVLFFGRSKKVIGPSPPITSRRNTNITCFPFTTGQRGGNSAMKVYREGRTSSTTQGKGSLLQRSRGHGGKKARSCLHLLYGWARISMWQSHISVNKLIARLLDSIATCTLLG